MLKRMGKEAHRWISDMFNYALQHDKPFAWTTAWIKLLHKGGDINNVKLQFWNYHGRLIDNKTIYIYNIIKDKYKPFKKKGKRAYGQVGLWKHHIAIDQLVTFKY